MSTDGISPAVNIRRSEYFFLTGIGFVTTTAVSLSLNSLKKSGKILQSNAYSFVSSRIVSLNLVPPITTSLQSLTI